MMFVTSAWQRERTYRAIVGAIWSSNMLYGATVGAIWSNMLCGTTVGAIWSNMLCGATVRAISSWLTLHAFFMHLLALEPHNMQSSTCPHGWSMIDTGSSSHRLHCSSLYTPEASGTTTNIRSILYFGEEQCIAKHIYFQLSESIFTYTPTVQQCVCNECSIVLYRIHSAPLHYRQS